MESVFMKIVSFVLGHLVRIIYFILRCFAKLRRKPKALSSTMTTEQKKALCTNLAKLEETIKKKTPAIYTTMAPPATDEEIAQLRVALRGAQIENLELWFRWHNGGKEYPYILLPLGNSLSISEALGDQKMIQDIPFVDTWRKGALKILDDGAGDGYFLDIANPNPCVFHHMLECDSATYYGTLEQFISFINTVHNGVEITINEQGVYEFEEKQYYGLEEEYLQKIGTH